MSYFLMDKNTQLGTTWFEKVEGVWITLPRPPDDDLIEKIIAHVYPVSSIQEAEGVNKPGAYSTRSEPEGVGRPEK